MPIRYAVPRCDEPELQGERWEDVAELAIRQKAALRRCNAQLDAIR